MNKAERLDHHAPPAALLVDLENVAYDLLEVADEAAKAFVLAPDRWVRRLECLSPDDTIAASPLRRFIMRSVYFPPNGTLRLPGGDLCLRHVVPRFLAAGFEVRQTHPLLPSGKNAADLELALDALDALEHLPHNAEIFVGSADCDFTPLLRRGRARGRTMAVVTAGRAAQAYLGVADWVIGPQALVRQVLGLVPVGEILQAVKRAMPPCEAVRLDVIATRVEAEIGRDVIEDRWAGTGSLADLLDRTADRHPFQVIDAPSGLWLVERCNSQTAFPQEAGDIECWMTGGDNA